MIDVKEIQVLNSKKCNCGYEFTLKDFTKLENLTDTHGFYANIVKHYSMAKCPKCQKEVILLLKQKGQTWEIMNTAKLINSNDNNVATIKPEIVSKSETIVDNKLICPVCKKVCKSKIGLNAHMKIHSK